MMHAQRISTPQGLIQEAARICEELISLLEEENKCLETKDMARIEAIGLEKDGLSTKLEEMLKSIKSWSATASESDKTTAKALATSLKSRLEVMNKLAERNFILLEAGFTATQNFLNILRRVMAKPKAQTYGSQGTVEKEENVSLVVKSV